MRFYENIFKPIPSFIFVLGIIIINPFHIPPDPIAKAEDKPVIMKAILVERTPEAAKEFAQKRLWSYGWDTPLQWECLLSLWTKESNWRPDAYNKQPVYQGKEKLNAGGIPQILGLDPATPPTKQIDRGLEYIYHRYDTPCHAWAHFQKRGWY